MTVSWRKLYSPYVKFTCVIYIGSVPTGMRKKLPGERLHDLFAIMDELKKAMCAMPDKDELRVCNQIMPLQSALA